MKTRLRHGQAYRLLYETVGTKEIKSYKVSRTYESYYQLKAGFVAQTIRRFAYRAGTQ